MAPVVRDPGYESRVRASFEKQSFMATLGARLTRIAPGEVDITISHRADLVQQHGFLHAGVVTSVVDSACGYAALTLMEPGAAVLSVEFKVNLLAPAKGEEFVARGRVIKSGRNIMVCTGELHSGDTIIAALQGTMMAVRDKGISD